MNNYSNLSVNASFTHIYIEHKIANDKSTQAILSHFPHAKIIYIDHYKDVFNRPHQNFQLQKKSMNLILARKEGTLFYLGAPFCQSFGEEHFYYTSLMMNCVYDCEYCYLQGMYPSANLVLFINIEDYFTELKSVLQKHSVYLCISYDTDLLAFESIHGYVKKWIDFVRSHPNLTVELRTKSANYAAIKGIPSCERFILAWTLSPDPFIHAFEHRTPSLSTRIQSIKEALNDHYPVRLCFDPMIHINNWTSLYSDMIKEVADAIPLEQVRDFSIGIFRISSSYLKAMSRARVDSLITHYPYENEHGMCHYENELAHTMTEYLKKTLCNYVDESKIFVWEEE